MDNLTQGQAGRAAMAAVWDGEDEAIRALVGADARVLDTKVVVPPEFDSRPDGQWGSLMTIAVVHGDDEMVTTLLDLGATPRWG